MLSYFPVAYPDELLYSMIARYAVHTGQMGNRKAVLRDIFGIDSIVAIPDLPSHLSFFRKRVSNVWQVKEMELINKHTMAPLHLPFLQPGQAKQIIKSMCSKHGGDIHTRCGISAGKINQTEFFRFCPVCMKEKKEIYGEPYWQRSHQIPGINVCYKHKTKLIPSSLKFHPKEKQLFQPAYNECSEKPVERLKLKDIEIRLLQLFQELLELYNIPGIGTWKWSAFYQDLAANLGLKTKFRIDHRSIRQIMERKWKDTIVEPYFDLEGSTNDWLVNIFRKHRKSFHPLRHLMVFAALLPKSSMEEIVHKVRSIAGEAGCRVILETQEIRNKQIILQKRKAWLELLKAKKGLGIKALRKINPGGALYTWLYRHDYSWLMEHKPLIIQNTHPLRRIEYEKWDKENLFILTNSMESMQGITKRPRLSRTFLIKQLPRCSSVEKHLDDLPRTNKWVHKNAETIENYQYFRVQNAAEILRKRHVPLKRWKILKLAAIRFNRVKPGIEKLIKDFEAERSVD